MTWIAELTLTETAPRAATAFGIALSDAAASLSGLASLDLYTPAKTAASDPLNPPEPPPALVALFSFDRETDLRAACASATLANLSSPGHATTAAFRRQHFPVPDGDGKLTAPVSYLVRYDLPSSDVAGFQALYVGGHPQVQARLPGIRTIICDIPIAGLGLAGLPNANWLIGNEVAFDSTQAFADAMLSPARTELRAHMADFPPWSGVNHHHLMNRRRAVP